MIENIELIIENKIKFVDQIHNEASYAEKIIEKWRVKLIGMKVHKIF